MKAKINTPVKPCTFFGGEIKVTHGLSKNELVKIAIKLKNNIDEAEQLSDYINALIAHCDKTFLQGFVQSLALSVKSNLEIRSFRENIVDDETELVSLIDFVLKGGAGND